MQLTQAFSWGRWIGELVSTISRKLELRLRLKNAAIRSRYREQNILIPPLGIIKLVTGTPDVEWFIETGKISAERVRSALQQIHVDPEGLDCILDFGCGCGRVLSHLADLKAELQGCDYNPKLLAWCGKLVPSAKLAINELAPPLPYESEKFDLVYAFSTFTHWSVELQKQWIAELTRVLRPKGLLYFTTHGEIFRDNHLQSARQFQQR